MLTDSPWHNCHVILPNSALRLPLGDNPIEFLWRKVKKVATHLRYFPTFNDLVQKVNQKLEEFTRLPHEITYLMGRYCNSLGQETA